MKKKIQLSTVRQEANVEVVFVNAALICKVINSHNTVAQLISRAINERIIKKATRFVIDENGKEVLDENGCMIEEPICDQQGNPITQYNQLYLEGDELRDIAEIVLPFLDELRIALEGE